MEWELKYSKVDTSIYLQAIKNNQPLPEFLQNKPELEQGLYFYMQAFFALETERNVGFSVTPIPVMKIIQYGEYLGYSNDEKLDDFVYIIRSLDNVAMNYYNKKVTSEKPKKATT